MFIRYSILNVIYLVMIKIGKVFKINILIKYVKWFFFFCILYCFFDILLILIYILSWRINFYKIIGEKIII